MKIDRFIAALRASGLEPDAETVADFFFLASFMPRLAELSVAVQETVSDLTDSTTVGGTSTEFPREVHQPQESQTDSARKTGLFTPSVETEGTVPAEEIEVPEAPALPRALEIARSLRPLSLRFRVAGTGVLDEEATAEQSAHHRQLILTFQPRRERWFDVALVVDDTPSMMVWKKTIEAFERMLADHGAFRDVRHWRLTGDGTFTDPAGRPATSSALASPDGRRIILILTQGVSSVWQSKPVGDAILEWTHRQPTAIVQLLPERLWENTRLGEPTTLARSPRPGLPNAQWDVELPAWMKRRIPEGVALPILALNPQCLGNWAQMLMARLGSATPCVYWSTTPFARSTDAKQDAVELSSEDRLDRFRRIASDDGFRLATALSASPVTLPVLRLVNQTLFGQFALQETLAQILLGGLLRKAEDSPDPELVYYDFFSGVRESLARSLDSQDRFAVRRQVTRYLQQHPDTTHRFRALVPHKDGKRRLPEWAMPFADEDDALLRACGLCEDGPASSTKPTTREDNEIVEAVIRRKSILIGIDEYLDADATALRLCANDARALESSLRELGFENTVLLNREATRARILATLENTCTRSSRNDLVWFHYSGHSAGAEGRSGIIPYDVSIKAPEEFLRLQDVADRLRQAGVRALITGDAAPPGKPVFGVAYFVGLSFESSGTTGSLVSAILTALGQIDTSSSVSLRDFAEIVRVEYEQIRRKLSDGTPSELTISLGAIGDLVLFNSSAIGKSEVRPDQTPSPAINIEDRLRHPPGLSKPKVSISAIPPMAPVFLGRDSELGLLDRAWDEHLTNFVQVVGVGGSGKTALVTNWLHRHLTDAPIFAWSFYRQSASEIGERSTDSFFASVLQFLELDIDQSLKPTAKAEVLARSLGEERVLLILDGIERLQDATGGLTDWPLRTLLQRLANHNKGLVVCTTRIRLADIRDPAPRGLTIELTNVTPPEGAEYLRRLGVRGTEEELRDASIEFDNHLLTLTLLGNHLTRFFDGDVRHRSAIPAGTIDYLQVDDRAQAGLPIRRAFVSSTTKDLAEFRAAASQILESLSIKSIGIEEFRESGRSLAEVDAQLIASADLFIGIYGSRYGYTPAGAEYSLTELEYREARRRGVRVVAFIVAADISPHDQEIDQDRRKLEALRSQVISDGVAVTVRSSVELAVQLRLALHKIVDPQSRLLADEPEAFKNAGRLSEAEASYRRLMRQYPNDIGASLGLAELLKQMQRHPEVEALYRETLQRFPEDLVARNGLAEVLKDLGQEQEALAFYRETVQRFPEDIVARNGLAEVLKDLGQEQEALAFYRETVQRFPEDRVARNGLAEILRDLGQEQEALAFYRETVQRFPEDLVARNGSAEILKGLGQEDEALAFYRETVQRFPEDPVSRNGLAEILKDLGQEQEALAFYRETVQRFPEDLVARNGLAEILKDLGQEQEALVCYRETVQLFPEDVVARNDLAKILKDLGQEQEALAFYRETVQRFPEDPVAPNGLAEILRKLGRLDEAEAVSDEATRHFPPELRPRLTETRIRTAIAQLARKYESRRASMPPSAERSAVMEGIANEMRNYSLAIPDTLFEELRNSDIPGQRLAAVVALEMTPRSDMLSWLAERLRTEKPFIGYHAARALKAAPGRLDRLHHDAIRQAVTDAIQALKGKEQTDRYEVLQSSLNELDDTSAEVLSDIGQPNEAEVRHLLNELNSSQTFDQAAERLQLLQESLGQKNSPSKASSQLVQEAVVELIANRHSAFAPPGHEELVCTKALECYAALIPWLKSPSRVISAFAQTKEWLKDDRIRKEAVRNVLIPLLNSNPDNPDILASLESILHDSPTAQSRDVRDLVVTTIIGLMSLPNVHPNDLARLLKGAFDAAARDWRAYGNAYTTVVNHTLRGSRLLRTDLDELLRQITAHIDSQGPSLLADERRDEYTALSRVIVAIHNEQGFDRKLRPRNRHIVRGEPGVKVQLQLAGLTQPVKGQLLNFAVGDEEWCGGAWVIANSTDESLARGTDWRRATIRLEHPSLTDALAFDVLVDGPYLELNQSGFRVKWPRLQQGHATSLARLAREYTATR